MISIERGKNLHFGKVQGRYVGMYSLRGGMVQRSEEPITKLVHCKTLGKLMLETEATAEPASPNMQS